VAERGAGTLKYPAIRQMIEGVNDQPGKVAAISKNAKNREGKKA
jgi:hypothetical protein